ncbi:MAG: hypothetical protein ACRD3W_14050, partial [Terriglobales bacterium]
MFDVAHKKCYEPGGGRSFPLSHALLLEFQRETANRIQISQARAWISPLLNLFNNIRSGDSDIE